MALECAHCGTRCDDGSPRCPRCLRATHLAPVEAAPPRRAPVRVAALAGALALAAAGGAVVALRRTPAPDAPRVPAAVAPAATDPLAVETPALRAVVERLRAERDATARARMAAVEVHQRRVAPVADDDEDAPPPRAPDLLWRVLPSQRERVTELDLARLVAALLRAAGDTTAAVAERTAPPRIDEPLDPSASRGAFVAVSGEHVVEVTQGTLVGAASVRHTALTAAELAGAISSQAALELAASGAARDRAVQYASAAVEAWTDSPAPLAARAKVWALAGSLPLAESDLRAAIAMRDDGALQLALARVRLLDGDVVGAARASVRAAALSPAWGAAAVALLALRPVNEQLDAGAPDACSLLRQARAPWTDDAYALCSPDVADDVRGAAARRLFEASRDPLRVAFAASMLGADAGPALRAKVAPHARREAIAWLSLLGRPELAAALREAPDAGR